MIRLERAGDCGLLRIDRPQALNALNGELLDRLGVTLDEVARSDMRALVITGAGDRAFCAGADVGELRDRPVSEARAGQELGQRKHMLAQALKALSDRERHIIVERRLVDEPKTLEDLSARYGISRERVRQIEVRAFDKLQKAMKNMVVEAAAENSRKVDAHATRH